MTNQTAKELLEKYNSGTISEDELAILESWYNQQAKGMAEFRITNEDFAEDLAKVATRLRTLPEKKSTSIFRVRKTWYIAASILFIATLTISYLYNTKEPIHAEAILTNNIEQPKNKEEISPGESRALLILEDDTQIALDEIESGNIKSAKGITISKSADGKLVYDLTNTTENKNSGYNTIITPAGGEYQVILSDGTSVWLNAKSSIKFPTTFGTKERFVETTGEVYFDVSHDPHKPFIVQTKNQQVKVLGTQFNINSYSDKIGVKTTLIEGSVLVKSNNSNASKFIKPGEESVFNQNNISISKVDLESAVAWKNGYFIFQDAELEDIMQQISRWYDADVEYATSNKNIQFGGAISKYRELPELLKLLEMTEKVKFKIQGRRIIVMN